MAFPTTGVLDNFNRTNANPLDGSWTNGWWDNGNMRLVSNQLQGTTANKWNGARYNAATYGADCEVYIEFISGADEFEICLRVGGTEANPDGYELLTKPDTDGRAKIVRIDDGA